jgi:hypothetical protein
MQRCIVRTQSSAARSILFGVAAFLLAAPRAGVAQSGTPDSDRPLLREVASRVALDPTTYGPTVVVYTARQLDWSSSQALFTHGYLEANPRYTVSGRPNDAPIGYAAGNRRIARETLGLFGWSAANNATAATIEGLLIRRTPRHRRLIRTLGWIERTAFASYWGYRLSKPRFEQWRANERVARELERR